MNTLASPIHAARYQQTKAIVLQIEAGDCQQAALLAEALRRQLPSPAVLPEDIQTAFFLNALLKRLDPDASEAGNLYLVPDEGQQIRMFDFMARQFPLVRFSQDVVNAAHLAVLQQAVSQGASEVLILDIGIGSGQQLARFLLMVAERKLALKQITVVGIEPAAESLKTAESALTAVARENKLPLRFVGFPHVLEALSDADWTRLYSLVSACTGPFLVNASFALHHTPPVELRDRVLAWLRARQAALVALIEPDADFLTASLSQRFDQAWQHYGLVFSAIDTIDVAMAEKNRVKTAFFSREIQDVMAQDVQRTERFETGEMWLTRFQRAGLAPYALPPVATHLPECPVVTIAQQPGRMVLNVHGSPVVSVLVGCTS